MYLICTTYRDDSIVLLRCNVCGISLHRIRFVKRNDVRRRSYDDEYEIETTLLPDYTSPLRKRNVRRKSRI